MQYLQSSIRHTHIHPFNDPFSGTTQVSRYQKGKTDLDFTEARYSKWQWHQLGHIQVCTTLQTDNHASTPPLSFLQAGCPSCHPTNSVKALKASLYPYPYRKPATVTTPSHEYHLYKVCITENYLRHAHTYFILFQMCGSQGQYRQ